MDFEERAGGLAATPAPPSRPRPIRSEDGPVPSIVPDRPPPVDPATTRRRETTMVRATWNDEVIAERDGTVTLEGNHYFPPDSVRWELLRDASTQSVCPWKGTAGYHDVVVGDEVAAGAAWTYPTPLPAAERITGHVAFWKGVVVSEG